MTEISGFRRKEVLQRSERVRAGRRFNFAPIKYFLLILIVLYVIYLVFLSPTFKIKTVEVRGIKSVEISDYIKRSLIGRNILFLRTGKFLRNLVKEYPVVEEAAMVRGLPDKVIIKSAERKQATVWCSDQCFEIDIHGYAYQAIERPKDIIILDDSRRLKVEEGAQVASADFIAFYLEAIDELDKIGIKVIGGSIDETTFKLTLQTQDGYKVIMDSSELLKNQVSALDQVLKNNRGDLKEYADVRVGGVVYLK